MTTQKHPFHLVDPSPWPLVGSSAAFVVATGTTMAFHNFDGGSLLVKIGFTLLLGTFAFWWRDVIREGSFEGQHTHVVQLGLRFGMILFIVSEVMFFVAFFWAFFWSSLAPTPEVGSVWPPKGIPVLSAWEIPFLNTMILLTSGATVTWAHHAMCARDQEGAYDGLIFTVLLAVLFTYLQYVEYCSSGFTIADSVYGSTFYMATGFHGFHVFVGTCFLTVCLYRLARLHFTSSHHFGFEAAAWYWHFVDVVWLFLFIAVYAWGGLLLNIKTMIYSPLEQFAIVQLLPFPVLGGLTNSMLFGTLGLSFWAIINALSTGKSTSVVPTRWATVVGSIYSLIIAIIHQTLGTSVEHTRNFFVYIFSLFCMILTLNMTGLVPYSFTVTSHLIVTLVLALSLWIGKANIATGYHGKHSVNLVFPSGVPLGMLFPMIILETLGFVITFISLSVRLFANMMAGHILLKVLAGFAWTMAISTGVVFLAHFGPLVVVYLMMGLETGIAFIQSYVFCLLACIYLSDSVEGGH